MELWKVSNGQSLQPALTTPGPPEEETLDVFLGRAQAAGLDIEEIISEAKARYNVDLSGPLGVVRNLQSTMEAAFGGGPPEGYREKTYTEEVLEPLATGTGMVEGALEGTGEIFGPAAIEAMVGKTPVTQIMKEGAGRKTREIKKEIDEVFAERHGAPALENIRDDLTENVEGVMELVTLIRGAESYTQKDFNPLQHLGSKFKAGVGVGKQFAHGATADLWSLGENPEGYFRARPITSGMILAGPLSEINRLAAAGYVPAAQWLKTKSAAGLTKVVDEVRKKTAESELAVKARRQVERGVRSADKKLGEVQRFLVDPFIQPTKKAAQLVEALVDTAKRTGSSIEQITNRWSEAIRRGYEDITPDRSPGVRIPYQVAEEAAGRARARERWDVGDKVKVLTQEIDYNPTTAHFGGRADVSVVLAEVYEAYKAGKMTKQQYEKYVRDLRSLEAEPVYIDISNTHWNETMGRFVDELDKLKYIDAEEVTAILNKNLADQAVGILRSANMRKLVIDDIVGQVREAGIYSPEQIINLQEKLAKFLDDMNKRDYENNVLINFGTPEVPLQISLANSVLKVLDETPKVRNKIYSEVIADVATDISADARINVISETLTDNMPLFTTEAEWIDHIMDSVIIKGEDLPPMIQANPHQLATRMLDGINEYARILAQSTDPTLIAQAERAIKAMAFKIRSYKRVPLELVNDFGIQNYIGTHKARTPGRKVPAKLEYEVFAPEGVIDTLKFERNAHKAIMEAKGFWNWLNRGIKGNLTARNLASALNNIKANFVYQTVRRANPMLAVQLVDMIRAYHGFRTGKALAGKGFFKISEAKRKFFEAMERTGYLNTTLLDAEIGGFGISDLIPVGKGLSKKLEKFYKAGDNIFKLEDAWHNNKKLKQDLEVLNAGERVTLEVKPGEKINLYRTVDGWSLDNKPITASQLDDIIAGASSVPGLRIFFDYTNVPNIVKWIRASKALGVTSPFFTWFYKAMDIPGVKRGLVRELFTDGVPYTTNSKALNASRKEALVGDAIRKQIVLSGMREAIIEPNNEKTLRKVLGYSPREFNIQLLEATTNPMWIGYDSEESANQFAPSDIMIRAILSGQALWEDDVVELYPTEEGRFGEQIDFDLSTVEDPETRRDILIRRKILKKHHAGEALTPADVAALIGVSGTPIVDGVMMLNEGSRQGARVSKPKLFQLVTTALLGGTNAALLDIAVAAVSDPTSPSKLFTTRRWAENEISEPQEQFIKWAIRRVTGIGFRPLHVGKRSDWYFQKKEVEWKNSLTGDLRELLEDNPDLTKQDRLNLHMRINELEKIVEGEMLFEKLHFQKVYEKLGRQTETKR